MLKKIYDKCIEWAGHKAANPILGAVSFFESFIFPIPTDAMLIPMVIAKRDKYIKKLAARVKDKIKDDKETGTTNT